MEQERKRRVRSQIAEKQQEQQWEQELARFLQVLQSQRQRQPHSSAHPR